MTIALARPPLRWSRAEPRMLLPVLALLASAALGAGIADPAYERLVLAGSAATLLSVLSVASPGIGLGALATWLVALGTIRRIAPGASLSGLGDPLLLVEPVVLVILVLSLPRRSGRPGQMSALAYAVLAFQTLAVLSALNPLQGGLEVGMAGLLFVPVPMLGFWVGRSLPTSTVARLLRLMAVLGIPVALYGLWQTLLGFPPWDVQWINGVLGSYVALNVGGGIRAFASLSSAAEYAFVLGIAIVVLVAGLRRHAASAPALAVLGLLSASVILESSRGIVVTGVLAVGAVTAARAGWRPIRAALAGTVLVVAVVIVSGQLVPAALGSGSLSGLLVHQVQGLADPFGAGSTLPLHIESLLTGLRRGLATGIGLGIGAVSIAAGRFGGVTAGTEVDPGNAAVALGIPGLLLYLAIAVTGLWRAYALARTKRDFVSLALLGVLVVTGLQWLNGGQYAVAWLVWVAFGAVDARALGSDKSPDRPPHDAVDIANVAATAHTPRLLHGT